MKDFYDIFLKHPKIATDTRKIEAGTLFFALKGANFDGNKFAEEALKKGAGYVVTSRKDLEGKDKYYYVPDTLIALQQLATFHRNQFSIPVLAITGSNGKTTTKELLAAIFSQYIKVHFTKGNFNNHIGVPLTLLEMNETHGFSIIEMGANQPGDIAELCEIAKPTHGIITNIGKAHLEGFGSLKGIIKTKIELYDFLRKHKGVAFVNVESPHLSEHVFGIKAVRYETTKTFGTNPSYYQVQPNQFFPTCKVTFLGGPNQYTVTSNLFGKHNFENIKTAIALGSYFKVPPKKIILGIKSYIPSNNRSQLINWNQHAVFLDAYNANPSSMRVAIESFKVVKSELPKLLILGDMNELGTTSDSEHQSLIDEVLQDDWEKIFIVGKNFSKVQVTSSILEKFKDVTALKTTFQKMKLDPHFILIKGSRGIALEKLIKA